jgi:hypothetical protein
MGNACATAVHGWRDEDWRRLRSELCSSRRTSHASSRSGVRTSALSRRGVRPLGSSLRKAQPASKRRMYWEATLSTVPEAPSPVSSRGHRITPVWPPGKAKTYEDKVLIPGSLARPAGVCLLPPAAAPGVEPGQASCNRGRHSCSLSSSGSDPPPPRCQPPQVPPSESRRRVAGAELLGPMPGPALASTPRRWPLARTATLRVRQQASTVALSAFGSRSKLPLPARTPPAPPTPVSRRQLFTVSPFSTERKLAMPTHRLPSGSSTLDAPSLVTPFGTVSWPAGDEPNAAVHAHTSGSRSTVFRTGKGATPVRPQRSRDAPFSGKGTDQ